MRKHIGILLGVMLLILPLAQVGADDKQDLLLVAVYGNSGENIELNVYDPAADISTPLLANYTANNSAYSNPILSADGRLAYSASIEGRLELDVWDSNQPDQEFVAVMPVGAGDQYALAWSPDGKLLAYQSTQLDGSALISVWDGKTSVDVTPKAKDGSISQYLYNLWSPDGRYLAFRSYHQDSISRMYVWDGKTTVDITQQTGDVSIVDYDAPVWSADDRLAFTGRGEISALGEIFVWDGHSTTNVSQNPNGNDLYPVWSADGRLAFQSEKDTVTTILIWDGVSLKDGQPDASTYATAAPDLNVDFYSIPTWTSAGQLAFPARSMDDNYTQIYVWDGQSATNISQNPNEYNTDAVWSRDGRWVFANQNPTQGFVYVRGTDNESLLMTKGNWFAQPAWSSTGNLTFCELDAPNWILGVWDGQTVHEIARGPHIRAQWQSGGTVDCFSG